MRERRKQSLRAIGTGQDDPIVRAKIPCCFMDPLQIWRILDRDERHAEWLCSALANQLCRRCRLIGGSRQQQSLAKERSIVVPTQLLSQRYYVANNNHGWVLVAVVPRQIRNMRQRSGQNPLFCPGAPLNYARWGGRGSAAIEQRLGDVGNAPHPHQDAEGIPCLG